MNQAEPAAEQAESVHWQPDRLMRPTPGATTRNTGGGQTVGAVPGLPGGSDAVAEGTHVPPQWQPIEVERPPWQEELRSGDRVYIRGIPRPVEVVSPQDDDEHIEVLLGTMRARIPAYQLERPAEAGLEGGVPESPSASYAAPGNGGAPPPTGIDPNNPGIRFRHNRDAGVFYRRPSPRQVKTDLDLRGQRVDEALDKVETLLNEAALSGVPEIRIIHGRGHRRPAQRRAGISAGPPPDRVGRPGGRGRQRRRDGGGVEVEVHLWQKNRN